MRCWSRQPRWAAAQRVAPRFARPTNLLDILPDLTVEVIELRDVGDRTLGAARIRGHGAGSDTPFDEPFWGVAEWRQGKCVRWANFGTEAEALEAVGLRE